MTATTDDPSLDPVNRDGAANQLGEMLVRLSQIRERQVLISRGVVDNDGVETAAYRLLFMLGKLGSMRSSELAVAAHSDPSTISRHVATLVDGGFVHREQDPKDRRASSLTITDMGIAKWHAILAIRKSYLKPFFDSLTDEDVRTYLRVNSEFLDFLHERQSEIEAVKSTKGVN